jgi:hypothetical protein
MAEENKQAVAPPETPPPTEVNGVPAPMAFNGKLMLRKAILGSEGDMIKEITLREPTGEDIERFGVPVLPNMRLDAPVMTQMMAHLAGVPTKSIRMMHPRDWTNGAYRLADFFVPDIQ